MVDALAQARGQGMVLVQHHCNFAIARAEHDLNMQPDQRPQPLLGIGDASDRSEHALLGQIHGMIHDLEEDFVFTLKVVIQPALAEL